MSVLPNINDNIKPNISRVSFNHEEILSTLCHYFSQPSYLLIFFVDRVEFGLIKEQQLFRHDQMNEEVLVSDIIELRLFNEKAELYLINSGKMFTGREVSDNSVNTSKGIEGVYDILHAVWGQPISNGEEWTMVSEKERGFIINLPIRVNEQSKEKVFYKVRNYFSYDDDGIIQMEDGRLMGFYNKKGEVIREVENVG